MFKYYEILYGEGGGGGGVREAHQKIPEDHDHKRGGGCNFFCQTEGAHKGNNYSQDPLSMGGSRGDIFIDQY